MIGSCYIQIYNARLRDLPRKPSKAFLHGFKYMYQEPLLFSVFINSIYHLQLCQVGTLA